MATKVSKNIAKARAAVTKPAYPLPEAVGLLQQVKYAKFDETVDLTMRLGVDTRHADQMVRGTVVLPHGLGKTKTVAVIASGDRQKEATAALAEIQYPAAEWSEITPHGGTLRMLTAYLRGIPVEAMTWDPFANGCVLRASTTRIPREES